jgi:hypothetical protein
LRKRDLLVGRTGSRFPGKFKMTGMPAFGITHPDDKIWAMVAFVRHLQKMTPEEYQNYAKAHSDKREGKTGD